MVLNDVEIKLYPHILFLLKLYFKTNGAFFNNGNTPNCNSQEEDTTDTAEFVWGHFPKEALSNNSAI